MAVSETQFAGSSIKIDSVVVARVTSVRRSNSMNEVDVTGAENVSGALAAKKFLPTSIEQTLEIEGITPSNSPTGELEPGQSALRTAADNGTQVVLRHLKPAGWGYDYTGYITNYTDGGAVDDVYKFTCSFRVNSKAAVAGT